MPAGGSTFSKEYVYLGDMPLAVTDGVGGFNFIHTDRLGTPRVITNAAAQAAWKWENLDPYGDNATKKNTPQKQGISGWENHSRVIGKPKRLATEVAARRNSLQSSGPQRNKNVFSRESLIPLHCACKALSSVRLPE